MELPIANVYQQSPRDERSTQWGPFNWHKNSTLSDVDVVVGGPAATAANVQPWQIPRGYVAQILNISLYVRPDALQAIVRWAVTIVSPSDEILLTIFRGGAEAAGVRVYTAGPQNVLLVDNNHYLRAAGVFDAGALANQITFSVQSLLMPRGNVAAF